MTYPRTIFRPPAFTLIEVMISIAIVLAMIIGVNQVFKITADTVGTGQAISATIRDSRAMQSVLQQDVSHAVLNDAPFLIIDARRQFAFRNAADKQGDIDGQPSTTDFDNDNTEGNAAIPGEVIPPTATNSRSHRTDTLSFFARDLFRRQTGNPGFYISDMSSNEAWITYAHGRVFDQSDPANIGNDANYRYPGEVPIAGSPNPKNYYASDWVLLRNAMLLVAPYSQPAGGYPNRIDDQVIPPPTMADAQFFWYREPASPPNSLAPLAKITKSARRGTVDPAYTITDGRYDLVGTTINDFRTILTNYLTAYPNNFWWDDLASSSQPPDGRFRCNPYPSKPIDSTKAAQTAPILASHCSQFIVEYAGDFLTQNAAGDVTALAADGQLDYFIEAATLRRVRWYGLPRDTNGDGIIRGWIAGRTNNQMVDVVPLRDVVRTFAAASNGASFERDLVSPNLDPQDDYADPGNGMREDDRYVCAWGPNDTIKPKMIRIVVTLDDPNGRLSDGQTFEYVINLP